MERGHKPSHTKQELQNVGTFNILSESSNESSLFGCQIELPKPFSSPADPSLLCLLHVINHGIGHTVLNKVMSVKVILQNLILPENLLMRLVQYRGDMNPMLSIDPKQLHFQKGDSSLLSTSNNDKD